MVSLQLLIQYPELLKSPGKQFCRHAFAKDTKTKVPERNAALQFKSLSSSKMSTCDLSVFVDVKSLNPHSSRDTQFLQCLQDNEPVDTHFNMTFLYVLIGSHFKLTSALIPSVNFPKCPTSLDLRNSLSVTFIIP